MNDAASKTIVVTGANGHLGKQLLAELGDYHVIALVRSASSKEKLQRFIDQQQLNNVEITECDYLNASEMSREVSRGDYVVHLVGVIKESAGNSFDVVHVQTTQVLADALKETHIKGLCYLSLLGADENSENTCFSTRAQAESILLNSGISSLLLRIPMVLGPGDYASGALQHRSGKAAFTFRADSLEQPIYAGDVVKAIVIDIQKTLFGNAANHGLVEWAGPESLSRRALQQRADNILGKQSTLISLPLGLGLLVAWIFEKLSASPPVSRAMLKVLDHDDDIDVKTTSEKLGIDLTGLDETLRHCFFTK